jgi:hypothetical protein
VRITAGLVLVGFLLAFVGGYFLGQGKGINPVVIEHADTALAHAARTDTVVRVVVDSAAIREAHRRVAVLRADAARDSATQWEVTLALAETIQDSLQASQNALWARQREVGDLRTALSEQVAATALLRVALDSSESDRKSLRLSLSESRDALAKAHGGACQFPAVAGGVSQKGEAALVLGGSCSLTGLIRKVF